ncbi:MAG TPA: hypothetical protein PLL26_06565 [Candidatus Dojkabacteria bacterium]|nr:hypothetical protein [Candidatus Dojkabacteria bacterium]
MKDYNKMTKEELIKELEARSPEPTTEDILKIMPVIKRIQLHFKDKT